VKYEENNATITMDIYDDYL